MSTSEFIMKDERTFRERLIIFFKKVIFCPQKIFFAGGEWFYSGKPSPTKSDMVAFNKTHVLKIENFEHWGKKNNLLKEAEILKYLKEQKGVSQVDFIKTGVHWTKRKYMIMERIYGKNIEKEIPDLLFSIMEQQRLGVMHHDIKQDNVFFDGLIARLIDYDQAFIVEDMKNMTIKENMEFFLLKLHPSWFNDSELKEFGNSFDSTKDKIFSYFNGNDFNFEMTSLYKSFKNKPYYSINLDGIKAFGRNNIEDLLPVLDKTEFEQNEKVLDLGCDTGALSFYLKSRGCDVCSCDTEENALLTTRMLANIYHFGCNVFKFGDFEEKYDTVFLLNREFSDSLEDNQKLKLIKNAKRTFINLSGKDLEKYPQHEVIYEFENKDKIVLIKDCLD